VAPSRSFDVRSAGPGDAEAVAACFHASVHGLTGAHYDARQRAAWAPDPPDVPARRERLGSKHTLLAVDGNAVLGFVIYAPDGHDDLLYTAAAAARRGVATRLHEEVERLLRAQGCARLFTEASHIAVPFFERQGYRVVERQVVERRGVSLERFAMAKDLDAER
jgi:putative acetyltransferase